MEIEKAKQLHVSRATAVWRGGFAGSGMVKTPSNEIFVALPKEFGGMGERMSPEDLLLSALASCFLVTLGIVLEKANVEYSDLSMQANLNTELGPPPRIREAVLHLSISSDADSELISRLVQRVDSYCLVSKALNDSIKKTVHIHQKKENRL